METGSLLAIRFLLISKDEETDVGMLDFVRLSATQSLSKDQVERYSRQLILPEVGVEGEPQPAARLRSLIDRQAVSIKF